MSIKASKTLFFYSVRKKLFPLQEYRVDGVPSQSSPQPLGAAGVRQQAKNPLQNRFDIDGRRGGLTSQGRVPQRPLEELAESDRAEIAQGRVPLVHQAVHDAVEELHGLRALLVAVAREPVDHLRDERVEEVPGELVDVAGELEEGWIEVAVDFGQLVCSGRLGWWAGVWLVWRGHTLAL